MLFRCFFLKIWVYPVIHSFVHHVPGRKPWLWRHHQRLFPRGSLAVGFGPAVRGAFTTAAVGRQQLQRGDQQLRQGCGVEPGIMDFAGAEWGVTWGRFFKWGIVTMGRSAHRLYLRVIYPMGTPILGNLHIGRIHIYIYIYMLPPQDLPFLGLHVSDSCSFPSRQSMTSFKKQYPYKI